MEEDWRLSRHDGSLLEQQRERGEDIVSSSPDSPGAASTDELVASEALQHRAALDDDWRITREVHPHPAPQLPGKAKGKGKKEAKTRSQQAWPRWTKPSPAELDNASPFLEQLVRLGTAARRSQRGDLVWLCWNGSERRSRQPMPQWGSLLLALSFRGAQRLKEEYWPSMGRSHFDISLKTVCENHARQFQASFVMPTIGHSSTHESDMLRETKPSEWNQTRCEPRSASVSVSIFEKEILPSRRRFSPPGPGPEVRRG